MPQLITTNRMITNSIHNNYKFIFFGLILIIYFIWMDIALFVNLQRWQPPEIENAPNSATSSSRLEINSNEYNSHLNKNKNATLEYGNNIHKLNKMYNYVDPFTVFKPLSVKLIMVDHASHYVHDILARFFEYSLHFTRVFPWVSANLVSFTGLACAMVGSRLYLSDRLLYRQIGAFLFEVRNFADSFDGVVFRARKRDQMMQTISTDGSSSSLQLGVYQSNYGSIGYNVDVLCDGFAGIFFILAVLIRFLRHPPQRSGTFYIGNIIEIYVLFQIFSIFRFFVETFY